MRDSRGAEFLRPTDPVLGENGRMEFKLVTADGAVSSYREGALYEFNNVGLLTVRTTEGTSRTYSPNAWLYIDEGSMDETSTMIESR